MTPNQQFWLQVISALFTGITGIILPLGFFWIRAKFAKQDADRADKTDEMKAVVTDCKNQVLDKVTDSAQTTPVSPVTVNVSTSDATTPDASTSPKRP